MRKITNSTANKMFFNTDQDHGDILFDLGLAGIEVQPLSKPVFDYTDDEGNDVYIYHINVYVKDGAYEAKGHSAYMAEFLETRFVEGFDS